MLIDADRKNNASSRNIIYCSRATPLQSCELTHLRRALVAEAIKGE
jgi:hypothetical protein